MLLGLVNYINDMNESKARTMQVTKKKSKIIKHQLNIQTNSSLLCAKKLSTPHVLLYATAIILRKF